MRNAFIGCAHLFDHVVTGEILAADVSCQSFFHIVNMLSSSSLLESRLNTSSNRSDPDTETKVRSSVRAINDTIQANANEPSLAFYRIQEHIRKSLPIMIQKRVELADLHERMNGLIFDVEYGVDAVKSMGKSDEHFNNIATYLEKSVYVSKQINILKQQQIQQQLLEKQ